MAIMPLGRRVDSLQPLVEENTRYVHAGVLTFAVEYRVLTEQVDHTVWSESDAQAFDDRGVTIHVLDAQTSAEYLRFDCFAEDPHYHYIWPSGGNNPGNNPNEVVRFDPNANGNMLEWTLDRLRLNLAGMLSNSGGAHLALQLRDPAVVATAVTEVDQLARIAQSTELSRGEAPSVPHDVAGQNEA